MLRHFIIGFSVIPALISMSSCSAEQAADQPTEDAAAQVETSENPFAAAARERNLAEIRLAADDSEERGRAAEERARIAAEERRAAEERAREAVIRAADAVIADPSSDPFDTLSPSVQAEIRTKYEACVADGRDFAAEEETPELREYEFQSWVDSCDRSRASQIRGAISDKNVEDMITDITSGSN